MKILIDFSQIPLQKVGVGIYALNLVSQIYRLDQENTYYMLVQDDESALNFIDDKRFTVIKAKSKIFRKFAFRFILEQIYIPYLVLRHKIDMVHSLHYSFPLFAPAKKAVTVHDLTFYKSARSHQFIKRYYFGGFLYLVAIFADRIIVDSNSTSNDFLQKFKVNQKKITVAHLGKDASFRPGLDQDKIEEVKTKYGIKKDYFLYLGTIEPRKNIRRLILAFNRFLKENSSYQLVIAGKKGWGYEEVFVLADDLHLEGSVNFIGFIDEKDKPYLISGAKIFIYPSLYEGFGIPVLEAMSCGIPTITSNVSSLAEISGGAALLINPLDENELYLNMKKILDDPVLYNDLKQNSIQRAKKFSWEITAAKTMEVYNSI